MSDSFLCDNLIFRAQKWDKQVIAGGREVGAIFWETYTLTVSKYAINRN